MRAKRRLTIARLMGLVLGVALMCAYVRQLNGFQLILLFIGVLHICLMFLYLYGIFRLVRWGWKVWLRWGETTTDA